MRLRWIPVLAMLFPLLVHAQSQEDPWLAIEDGWIWAVVDQPGDLAGSWALADGVLQNDVTYRMTFTVTEVEGTIALYLGDAQRFLIDAPGAYSYDFTANDRKRMVFSALDLASGEARLAANSIRVGVRGAGPEPSNPEATGDPWLAEHAGWIWQPTSTLALLGGSWWNDALQPGATYRISFDATEIAGGVGLLLGDRESIAIREPGTYTFDFTANEKKRMAFYATRLDDGKARLVANTIRVQRLDTGPAPGPGTNPTPTVDLSATDASVPYGTRADLAWMARNADSCQASGGWGGARSTSGTARVGPIVQQTTFGLSCSGEGGSAMSMISVSVNGAVVLEWQRPTRNTDGTRLTDLAGYRIYIGDRSRRYSDVVPVSAASATTHDLTLPPGTWYVAMTALNSRNEESFYSNEAVVRP